MNYGRMDRLNITKNAIIKAKKEMNIVWKIFYYIWSYKLFVWNASDEADIQFRLLHPIWFLFISWVLIYWILNEWLLDKEMWQEMWKHITII